MDRKHFQVKLWTNNFYDFYQFRYACQPVDISDTVDDLKEQGGWNFDYLNKFPQTLPNTKLDNYDLIDCVILEGQKVFYK